MRRLRRVDHSRQLVGEGLFQKVDMFDVPAQQGALVGGDARRSALDEYGSEALL